MVVKVSDASGEGWVSAFNDEAEKIICCSADELDKLKSKVRCQMKIIYLMHVKIQKEIIEISF